MTFSKNSFLGTCGIHTLYGQFRRICTTFRPGIRLVSRRRGHTLPPDVRTARIDARVTPFQTHVSLAHPVLFQHLLKFIQHIPPTWMQVAGPLVLGFYLTISREWSLGNDAARLIIQTAYGPLLFTAMRRYQQPTSEPILYGAATRLATSFLKLEKLPACDYQSAAFFWMPLDNSPASTFLSGSNHRNPPLAAANLGAFYLFGERERDAITTLTIIFIVFFVNPMLLTHAYSFHSHPLKMPRSTNKSKISQNTTPLQEN